MKPLPFPVLPALLGRLSLVLLAMLASACSQAGVPRPVAPALPAYADDAELAQALDRWRAEAARRMARQRAADLQGSPPMLAAAPAPAAAPAAKAMAESSAAAGDGITNVQVAGVDEGGIVKRAGDFLVVLRRGRLFTLRIGGEALEPVAMADAFGAGIDPRGAWYDELLVSGRTVVVVGFSYARGGTEIGLFDLDDRGGLQHRATHHLRSHDYYSARNYASRLLGRQLVFYSPTVLQPWGPHPLQLLPRQRPWSGQAAPDGAQGWQRILPATRIFRSDDDFDPGQPLALHTVTRCDLAAEPMRCEASAVLGPAGRVFHVSAGSVYVWTGGGTAGQVAANAVLFRLRLDGGAPTAIKAVGMPIDPLSFLEGDDGHLNVVLRAQGPGEGLFGSQPLQGETALLRLPLSALGDGRGAAQASHYRRLPARSPTQNRFVGDWLLLGGAAGPAWALKPADETVAPQPLDPGHRVERIEALGRHALLAGNAGADLHLSAVRLDPRQAALAGRHVQPAARQGETRTHGFMHRATGEEEGLLGLPIVEPAFAGPGRPSPAWPRSPGTASVLFVRDRGLDFRPLGALQAGPWTGHDGCRAGCVDWYGNARPLFIGDRVFALLGYELVEGRVQAARGAEHLGEVRRIGFAPRPGGLPGGRASPFQPALP